MYREGAQSFTYLTPRIKLTPRDLVFAPSPFVHPRLPEWLHVVSTTERIRDIANDLDRIRREGVNGVAQGWKAKLVWEPLGVSDIQNHPSWTELIVQPSCTPEDLEDILEVLPRIAVFSPNLLEMQSILSLNARETPNDVEHAAHGFANLAKSRHGLLEPAIIVRAGGLGSYTLSPNWTGWVPAYWGEKEQDQVVDVTGGGNAWLGGLVAGLLLTEEDYRAGESAI